MNRPHGRYDWTATILPATSGDGQRVYIWNRIDHNRDRLIESLDRRTAIRTVDLSIESDDNFPGLLFPHGVIEAIAEAHGPTPHEAELRRLEEALAVERRRVDDLLKALTARNPT